MTQLQLIDCNNLILINILVPGLVKWPSTTGFSRTLSDKNDLSLAFIYLPSKTVSGQNPLSLGQTNELEMYQLSF